MARAKHRTRRFVLAAGVLAIVIAMGWWLSRPQPVVVEVGAVARGDVRVVVEDDGQTRIRDRFVVSAPLAGRLLRVELKPGDEVVAGQTRVAAIVPVDPALLDPRAVAEAEARVRTAKAELERAGALAQRAAAELEQATTEVHRQRNLVDTGASNSRELEDAQLIERVRRSEQAAAEHGKQVAEYGVQLAEAALRYAQGRSDGADAAAEPFSITAPCTGRVLRVMQESSTIVTPGQGILEVGDPTNLEVVVDVLSTDAVQIVPGQAVSIERWGGVVPLQSAVRRVEPAGFTKISALGVEEQRVNVIIDFVSPIEERPSLGDAFRVEAAITVDQASDVLTVPANALFKHEGKWAVFVLEEEVARVRKVSVGLESALVSQIVDGVSDGQEIVLHPDDRIFDGVLVQAAP